MWDPENCNPCISISQNALKITQTENAFGHVLGLPSTPKITSDSKEKKFYFEIKINLIRGGIFIGIVNQKFNFKNCNLPSKEIGDFVGSWAMDSYSGSIGTEGKWKSYGKKLKKGDLIGVLLDLEQQTLSFTLNNQNLGVAFTNLVPEDIYFPAISLKFKLTSVTASFKPPFFFPLLSFQPFTFIPENELNEMQQLSLSTQLLNKQNSWIYSVPNEVIQKIFVFLPLKDLISVSKTCKLFNSLVSDPYMWKLVWNKLEIQKNQTGQSEKISHKNHFKKNKTKNAIYSKRNSSFLSSNIFDQNSQFNYREMCHTWFNWENGLYRDFDEYYVEGHVNCVVFDSTYLVTGIDEKIVLFNLIPSEEHEQIGELGSFVGHEASISCLDYNGSQIFSGSRDGDIKLWNIESGYPLASFSEHHHRVSCLQRSGNLAFSGSFDRTAILWDLQRGDQVSTFIGHTGYIYDLKYCTSDPSSKQYPNSFDYSNSILFTCGYDKTIRMWDVRTVQCVNTFRFHTDAINSLEIFNNCLFSASSDRSVRVCDLRNVILDTPSELLAKMTGPVQKIQIQDQRMLTSTAEGIITIWDPKTRVQKYSINGGNFCTFSFGQSALRLGRKKKIRIYDFSGNTYEDNYSNKRRFFLRN